MLRAFFLSYSDGRFEHVFTTTAKYMSCKTEHTHVRVPEMLRRFCASNVRARAPKNRDFNQLAEQCKSLIFYIKKARTAFILGVTPSYKVQKKKTSSGQITVHTVPSSFRHFVVVGCPWRTDRVTTRCRHSLCMLVLTTCARLKQLNRCLG